MMASCRGSQGPMVEFCNMNVLHPYSVRVAALVTFSVVTLSVRAENPPILVTGGADESGHLYAWKITNQSSQSIVEVRFPHFRANLFFPPPGWEPSCTGLVAVGAKIEPGVCTARVPPGKEGIAPGRSAEFKMQIASAGARRFPGHLAFRFADGTESDVGGVELPTRETAGDQYVSLIGLGMIFVLLTVRQARRKRRASAGV